MKFILTAVTLLASTAAVAAKEPKVLHGLVLIEDGASKSVPKETKVVASAAKDGEEKKIPKFSPPTDMTEEQLANFLDNRKDTGDTERDYSPLIQDDLSSEEGNFWKRSRDYCYDDEDYGCYEKGVPHCCIVSKRLKSDTCPAVKPRCDLPVRRSHSRHKGRVRRTIRAGNVCRFNDICENGYDCIDGICRLRRRAIPVGAVCRYGDVCADGYSCIDGYCGVRRRSVIPMGAVCRYGDVCADGYSCIDGYCGVRPRPRSRSCSPATHAGGDCTNTRCCVPGYQCQPSRLNGSDRSMCYRGASVQATTE